MAVDPDRVLEKATEALAGSLAQLRHIRFHMKDQIPEEKLKPYDEVINALTLVVEKVARLEAR